MGQIVSAAAKPKRCNLNQLSQVPTPAAGEYILVSSDNSMNAAGQGNFDCYIVGNGRTSATALELKRINSASAVGALFADLNISDDNGNCLAEFKDGHFRTSKFDSRNTLQTDDNNLVDFGIVDENGKVIAEFYGGWFRTKNFDASDVESRLAYIEDAVGTQGQHIYAGNKIHLGGYLYHSEVWKTFSGLPMVQSFATHGDFIVFLYGAPNYGNGSVWRISTGEKLADITLPHDNYNAPHANVCNFSNAFAYGNTDLPLLYVSQWDNQGGCFVYDVHIDGTCTLVQTIMTDGNMGDAFGLALGDWVIDSQNGYIWSAKYKVSAYHADGNAMMFCKFNIPDTSQASVVLTASDILESFSIEDETADLTITQDKIIDYGKMYIVAGYGTNADANYPAYLFVIDLFSHSLSAAVKINDVVAWEPEGLDIKDGALIYSFGGEVIYKLKF